MPIRTAAAATIILSLTLAACSTNPATGRTQFDALSRDQEIQIGQEATPDLVAEFGGAVPNQRVQAYVSEVGARIAAQTESDNPDLPWEFTVVDSDVINAFALPGGKVFISRGMAAAMDNEAQLAGVLGHEIGHVTARHVNERFSQQMGIGLGATVIGGLLGDGGASGQIAGIATEVGGSLVLLSFSRSQELEADQLGMRYMTQARYNPRGALEMIQVLQREAQGRGGIEFFSTHPNPDTRIDRIQSLLAGEYAQAAANPDLQISADRYQQNMLSELARTPPAPGRTSSLMQQIALNNPSSWCATCASGGTH